MLILYLIPFSVHTKDVTEFCGSRLQPCLEAVRSLVLQSQSTGQRPCLCCLCVLQAGHLHASDSLSGQRAPPRLHQCTSEEKHTLLFTDHLQSPADCQLLEKEETHGTDVPSGCSSSSPGQLYSHSESLAPSPQSKHNCRPSCAPGGTLPSSQGSDPLTVADSREFPCDTSGQANPLWRLICGVWTYVLEMIHTVIGTLRWRMLSCITTNHSVGQLWAAFADSPSGRGTTAVPDRTPGLILENYGGPEVKKSLEMNLRQKRLEHLLGASPVDNQTTGPQASDPSRPRWLWRPLEDSELEPTGTETPFISQETRDRLEFNVKNKLLQRLWGLPTEVQLSQTASIPDAPELNVTRLLPKSVPDFQVATTCQPPSLTEEQQNTLMKCISQKQDVWTEGYPEIVMESRTPFEMPESMSENLRQADVTEEAKEAAEGTSAKKRKKSVKPKEGNRTKPSTKKGPKALKTDNPSPS